jgi:hypothetical protein
MSPTIRAHLICPILGIVIILFFQRMGSFLNPIDRTSGRIKCGLVVHTAAMFSVLTLNAAMSLDIYSISYVDDREFHGANHTFPPGPYGFQWIIYPEAISTVPNVMLYLNTCLADGFSVSPLSNKNTCVLPM